MNFYAHTLAFFIAALTCAGATTANAVDGPVAIFTDPGNSSYTGISDRLAGLLRDTGIETVIVDIGDAADRAQAAGLTVAVGNRASDTITATHAHQRVLSIRTAASDRQHEQHAELLLGQPLCRQLALIRHLSDRFSTVSIISSAPREQDEPGICPAAAGLRLRLISRAGDETLNSVITRALNSDVLLATPDIGIFNSRTIKNVLLLSYRKRIPVIGFSRSFVIAGAMAGLHSTPEKIAHQAADIITGTLRSGGFARDSYTPDDFEIAYNRQVSKSLGFELPDIEVVRGKILGGERDE